MKRTCMQFGRRIRRNGPEAQVSKSRPGAPILFHDYCNNIGPSSFNSSGGMMTAAATLSSGSRLSRRTPWVARTCLVSIRMILPYWPGAPPLSQLHRELVGCYRRSLAYQSRRRPDSTRRHRIVESWAAFCGMLATYRSPLADRTKSWRGFRARPTDAATCLPIYPPHR